MDGIKYCESTVGKHVNENMCKKNYWHDIFTIMPKLIQKTINPCLSFFRRNVLSTFYTRYGNVCTKSSKIYSSQDNLYIEELRKYDFI